MPDIGKALKDEIARIARKEVKSMLSGHLKTIRELKHEVAALKRQVPAPARPVAVPVAATTAEPTSGKNIWFTGSGVKGLRTRLGLSQSAFAKLCGVSSNAVGLWENAKPGKLNLRTATRNALIKMRGLSPVGAKKALSTMEA